MAPQKEQPDLRRTKRYCPPNARCARMDSTLLRYRDEETATPRREVMDETRRMECLDGLEEVSPRVDLDKSAA